ncbi:MAG TPA: phosphotransferase [Ktedonobacteraceae bacterium]|nr:phosphotransferase [Ktedonobacteraceae bacterium]
MTAISKRTLDAKLPAIAHHFDLGQVLNRRRIAHSTNQNYLVTTTRGEYLFKIIVNTTLEDVLNGLPFLQRLEQQQFRKTAYYLAAPNGEIAYHSPDCDAVVLRKLPGGTPELSPTVCHEIGIALAQLHLIPCDNLPEKRHWLDARYLPEAIQAAVKMYGPEKLSETLKVFDSLHNFQPATFPQAIIHGDLCAVNCLFEGEELIAFVDWQEVGVGAALIDFVSTVLGFCFIDQPDGHEYWAIFEPNLYRALYEGYSSIRPLSEYEEAHLDDALKYVGLTQPVWSMLMWEQYHRGQEMIETNTMYWKFGLDTLTLPKG